MKRAGLRFKSTRYRSAVPGVALKEMPRKSSSESPRRAVKTVLPHCDGFIIVHAAGTGRFQVALCKSAFYVAVHNYYHRAFHGAPVLRTARVGDRQPGFLRILWSGTSKSTDVKENLQSACQKAELSPVAYSCTLLLLAISLRSRYMDFITTTRNIEISHFFLFLKSYWIFNKKVIFFYTHQNIRSSYNILEYTFLVLMHR